MKIPTNKLVARPLLIGLLFTILIAVACAPSPEYPEGSSWLNPSENESINFGGHSPLFAIDLGNTYGVTEIYRGTDSLFYGIDPSSENGAHPGSRTEIKEVTKELIRRGYAVKSIEYTQGILFIHISVENNTTSTSRDETGIIIPLGDILGE